MKNCLVCEQPDERDDAGAHKKVRPSAGFAFKADLKAVRTGIGAGVRTLHSDVLREEVPDLMAELLRQLDKPR